MRLAQGYIVSLFASFSAQALTTACSEQTLPTRWYINLAGKKDRGPFLAKRIDIDDHDMRRDMACGLWGGIVGAGRGSNLHVAAQLLY
jgi:hypothetical protein